MFDVKKILCPVDFSDAVKAVAECARKMALQFDAEVLLLYVSPRMNRYAELYVPNTDLQRVVRQIADGARKNMDACLKEHFQGIKVTSMVKIGYAPEAICDVALEEHADLIVMGTHGRRGIDRVIFGSVAEKVVKSGTTPVLLVRPFGPQPRHDAS
ncbi:MAG: universal stress protein [Desulfovibrionaceae bacterium]